MVPPPGYVFRDGGPVPDCDLKDPQNQTVGQQMNMEQVTRTSTSNSSNNIDTPSSSAGGSSSSAEVATESHALANADHEEKGAVQQNQQDGEVRDMGWSDPKSQVPTTLVGGLPNEELWTLVRRFNKQMYHVKATNAPLLAGLDVNIVDEDEFSPDKLRSNVERLYMTVIIGLMGFGKHIARLRSWREPRRTGAFCVTYAIAWVLNILMPLCFTTLVVLIVYPPSRAFLFPPAPLALVSASTGGVQSPKAGVLGSHDSATGAPEKHQGEAVEAEAHNFVTGIGSIALSSAAGKHDQGDPESDPVDSTVPDPTRLAAAGAEAKVNAAGGEPDAKHDKTKQPMEDAMWKQMRPIMHVIGDIADGWERFANALSPTKPFPQEKPRVTLASAVAPLVAASLLTSSSVFMKMVTGGIGFGFFGDPLIWRGLDFLNKKIPDWPKYLEIRNSILKGVPTNAQLTVTLLRIGEANKAPIPPPPRSDEPPPSKPASINGDHVTSTLDTDHEELHDAIHKSDTDKKADAEYLEQEQSETKHKHHTGERVIGFFKGTTNAGVQTKFGLNKTKAHILGSAEARERLGILPQNMANEEPSGPVDFKSRYKGSKGWTYISTIADVPTVSFSYQSTDGSGVHHESKAKWSIPIDEISEIKKIGGLGWKGKIVVGWATGKQVADGMEIYTKGGDTYKVTAIRLRDELFNRLIAIDGQKWECL
ncbi:uncharacterized protein KY384_000529 [Bacidia gigantensis]|uniref:uncharacterized protein n=1 Tax=Bacidia gigantensis TaxID=2732470 RepID=UPI001D04BFB9|nr:uncharacterized protein KY384_000529 [Bacidia gigantensis]KAG8525769.1 hypothetical protein KY384_000529 [Bacidia gigantensis]